MIQSFYCDLSIVMKPIQGTETAILKGGRYEKWLPHQRCDLAERNAPQGGSLEDKANSITGIYFCHEKIELTILRDDIKNHVTEITVHLRVN